MDIEAGGFLRSPGYGSDHVFETGSERDENHGELKEKLAEWVENGAFELDVQWVDLRGEAAVTVLSSRLQGSVCLDALATVAVGGCHLGDEGTLVLLKALRSARCASLSVVDLFFNQITAAGAASIATVFDAWHRGCPSYLGLAWNDIGDDGAKALLPLLLHPSLTALSLANCLVTQRGALMLADHLAGNATLRSIRLDGNDDIAKSTLETIKSRLVKAEGEDEEDAEKGSEEAAGDDLLPPESPTAGFS
ncbi:RAN GTPase-activating protein 1 [Diplonema papillatum]|nr:RAN GTPase-activating protein 1 [Diplonema papillatum]